MPSASRSRRSGRAASRRVAASGSSAIGGRRLAVVLVAQVEAEEGLEAHQASARAAARGARITSVSAVSAPASIVTVRMR